MHAAQHTAIFREYYGLVRTIVQGRLMGYASPEDVEECISDVFADLFLMLDDGIPGNLKGCIRMLANRRAVDCYRKLSPKSGKTIPLDEALEISSGESPAESSERSEQSELLLQSIQELGEPDSRIIIQKYFFHYSSSQIAKSLHITPSAVRKRCQKALEKLRIRLTELGLNE